MELERLPDVKDRGRIERMQMEDERLQVEAEQRRIARTRVEMTGDRERGLRDADDPRIHRSRVSFMKWALDKIRDESEHPLRFLLSPKENTRGHLVDVGGKPLSDSSEPVLFWNQFTRRSESGRLQRGRYPLPWKLEPSHHSNDEEKFTVQAGHRLARVSGGTERFMVEDADSNHIDGYLIEGRGSLSRKESLLIGGIMVDVATAKGWAAAGQLGPLAPKDIDLMEKFVAPEPTIFAPA